jgi:hypothetical protein
VADVEDRLSLLLPVLLFPRSLPFVLSIVLASLLILDPYHGLDFLLAEHASDEFIFLKNE